MSVVLGVFLFVIWYVCLAAISTMLGECCICVWNRFWARQLRRFADWLEESPHPPLNQ